MDYKIPADFVLVFNRPTGDQQELTSENERLAEDRRTQFEAELSELGLQLEREVCGSLIFVKIYAPKPVVRKYCDIMKLHMPLKKKLEEEYIEIRNDTTLMKRLHRFCSKTLRMMFTLDPRDQRKRYQPILQAEYSRDKSFLFDEDDENFFSETVRILVIDFILNQQKWSDEEDNDYIGIQHLLNDGTYDAAYPLHDGSYDKVGTTRNYLMREWAQLKNWIRYQPIDKIKEYLGVKHAFYFAWLGFYNHLLVIATIAGMIVLLYGYFTVQQDYLVSQACNKSTDIMLCPRCDHICDYQNYTSTCAYVTASHLFDNSLTVIFALFMSVWGTVFLELWKRYSAVLTHSWGFTGYTDQAEHPRPRYLEKLSNSKHKKLNVVTNRVEPVVPFWAVKVPITFFSYTVILFFVFLAIGAVCSIVLFRMWMITVFSHFESVTWFTRHASKIVTVTGATLNLISIMLLNQLYQVIAAYLTNLELPRSQTDYDKSLTIKIYLFQFVNYYASLIYVAFFKGKFIGYPADYNRIFGFRQEECNSGGCLMDLSFQLAFIMIGKQILGCVLEMCMPIGKNALNTYSTKKQQQQKSYVSENEKLAASNERNQWIEDYKLLDWNKRGLFYEYLEMVVQFGFVTLFVTAFPLAPFFALLNNIFELRLDARKALKYYRRPIPHVQPNIGVWYRILDIVSKLAVVTNAVIIAFSTDFIPILVYKTSVSTTGEMDGYLNYTLSYFNTADFPDGSAPQNNASYNVSICRYRGLRKAPWEQNRYHFTSFYSKVLVARILFIVLFQNIVYAIKIAVQWLIPDTPQTLKDQMKKESYMTTQLIIKREKELLLGLRYSGDEKRFSDYNGTRDRDQIELTVVSSLNHT